MITKFKNLIVFIVLLLVVSTHSNAQRLDTIFQGYLSPFVETSGSVPPLFNFQAVFRNIAPYQNSYDTTGTDLSVIIADNGFCYKFPVVSLNAVKPVEPGALISGVLIDSSGVFGTLPSEVAAIVSSTENKKLLPFVSNLREDLQACMLNQNFQILDTLAGGGTTAFDADRPILRTPQVGTNIGTSTIPEWLEWWYFTAPSISLAISPTSPIILEIGDSITYTFNSTTSNPGNATLSNGQLFRVTPFNSFINFAANTVSGTVTYQYRPNQAQDNQSYHTLQMRATQDWVFGAESGTAISNTRTVRSVYPVLYGMAADTATVFADVYGELSNKLVQTEGNKSVSYTGSGLIFYCMPETWANNTLTVITDPNGFNSTASFSRRTGLTMTATGLFDNYIDEPCVCYWLNTGTTTTNNSVYTFNR